MKNNYQISAVVAQYELQAARNCSLKELTEIFLTLISMTITKHLKTSLKVFLPLFQILKPRTNVFDKVFYSAT